jgi:hypothetical protein
VLPLTYCVGSYTSRLSELVRQKASVLSVRKVTSGDKKVEVLSKGVYEVKRAEEPMINGDKTLETGFYRVKYDEVLASRLRSAISTGALEATDRFGTCFLYSIFPYS